MRTPAREGTTEAAAGAETDERLSAALEAQRERFDRELVRRAFRISALEEELEELRRGYESSLSWRITRPLRAAKDRLRRHR
jgi:hypothetical protein